MFQTLLVLSFSDIECDACVLAKQHKLPFDNSSSYASKIFELVHMDLWGPYRTQAYCGARYFLTVLDDHSRATWTLMVNNKEQVPRLIENFLAYVETQFSVRVQFLRTDNGTEFVQRFVRDLLLKKGIVHQRSSPGVPEQNGRVERKHRHLLETARAIRLHSGLPLNFWSDCVLSATHLINLLPSLC